MKSTTHPLQGSDIFSALFSVAAPCGANWFALVIARHRVVAAGAPSGFSSQDDEHGFHLRVKRWLLSHEGAVLGTAAAPWQQTC